MESGILCSLLSKRIDPEKYQVRGTDVFWLQTPTSEDLDNAVYVTDNYEALAEAYLAEESAAQAATQANAEAKAQAIITNLPTWAQVSTVVDNISNLAEAKVFIKKLARIVYWLAKDKAA